MPVAEGSLTSLAFCWRLERSDGAGLGLTSSDRDLEHAGTLYGSAPGITPAAVTRSLGLDPDVAEVAGALSSDALTEADLVAGRWNGARMTLFAADWANPDAEPSTLLRGELGEVSVNGEGFSAELRGAAARLSKPVCPHTSSECRASLGDKQCRADLAQRTIRGRVISGDGNVLTLPDPVDAKFLFGRLRYLGGPNCGAFTTILGIDGAHISVRDRLRMPITDETAVEIREGCDKRFETCIGRFQNAANFRGEPHLPGNDLLTRYPGA